MNREENKKRVLIIVLIIILIVVFVVVAIIWRKKKKKSDFDTQMTLGEQYLVAREYSQAITALEKALKEKDTDADLYLKLAEAYKGDEHLEQAIEVLEKGYGITKDERLYHEREAITNLLERSNKTRKVEPATTKQPKITKNDIAHNAYLLMVKEQSYPELKSKLEMDIGLPYVKFKENVIMDDFNDQHKLNMLCLDIDGDGIDEFLLEVCNVYKSQSLICIYNYQKDKVGYVDAFSAYPEPDHLFEKPFDLVGEDTPILWFNKDLKTLYAVSFYDISETDKHEEFCAAEYQKNTLTTRYIVYDETGDSKAAVTKNKLYQIGEEFQELVSEKEYITYRDKYFSSLGEVVKFESYHDFIRKYGM
ncbi:MAG: tetratricopeptide repeat protein [bacterium]|nr:tetratricopeptide repeat protein [bacterium]